MFEIFRRRWLKYYTHGKKMLKLFLTYRINKGFLSAMRQREILMTNWDE